VTAAPARDVTRPRGRVDRKAVAVLAVLFAATLLVSQSCQQSQVRVSQATAIATAREQVSFTPRRTQVRLVRQGFDSRPFWAVSLSVPRADGTFARLATVRVDANTGQVAAVNDDPRAK
jgi:hypothetical protein